MSGGSIHGRGYDHRHRSGKAGLPGARCGPRTARSSSVGKVSRERLLPFLAGWPGCIVAMEACGTAHDWGRGIEKLGHTVRLIPPIYVKPFVKRQKNDAADAEAIAERGVATDHAAQSREVPGAAGPGDAVPDTGPSRAAAHAADQRAPGPPRRAWGGGRARPGASEAAGLCHRRRDLAAACDRAGSSAGLYLEQIAALDARVGDLDRKLRAAAVRAETTRRLQTMPGVGPVTAVAVETFAPPMETFPPQSGLRSLARAATAQGGRQAAAREDVEDGRAATSAGCSSSARWR